MIGAGLASSTPAKRTFNQAMADIAAISTQTTQLEAIIGDFPASGVDGAQAMAAKGRSLIGTINGATIDLQFEDTNSEFNAKVTGFAQLGLTRAEPCSNLQALNASTTAYEAAVLAVLSNTLQLTANQAANKMRSSFSAAVGVYCG
ncbi:hypothetical protein FB45DRAFT_1044006 [Roridomyces roridus]|uniref:Uncharacterized protein n=1 Tax=Roridomyces roridus TaxID=1738132 RepID=A0AAD7F685_9AGAR|nr:hypothetical protein FB45DRAFT_1044006 [Roridomyces roridus]